MPVIHRPIPALPICPRARSIAADLQRSYPTGRKEISRAIAGRPFELTLSTPTPMPDGVRANLVTTLNSDAPGKWVKVPFAVRDERTLICQITPEKPGLYAFWTQFSVDGGSAWLHDPVPDAWVLVDPPQVDALRLYTLIPAVSGTITDWAAELTRIAGLGFNAVHFLPLTTLDTSLSPYSAKDLFGVEPAYVDPAARGNGLAQLDALVDHAKTLGVRLCFDLVLNHIGTDSDIVKKAPGWIVPDAGSPDGLKRAGYWSDKGWQPWQDLMLLNYEHPNQPIRDELWGYMQEYALFWSKYASETDGFVRFDNLHSSDKPFVDALTQRLRAEYPNLAVIAEYFTDTDTMLATVPRWGLSLVLATPWDSRFVRQLRDYLRYLHSMADHVRFFMPVSSHDSGTPAQEFASADATRPRYVAAALLGTGATGITQGVEWGQKQKIEFIGRQEKLAAPQEPMFGDFLRRVNAILAAEPAFRTGVNCQFVDNGHDAIIAAYRADARPGHLGLLVVCNFDILGHQDIEIDLTQIPGVPAAIHCVDLLNEQVTFIGPRLALRLPACGVHVLRCIAAPAVVPTRPTSDA